MLKPQISKGAKAVLEWGQARQKHWYDRTVKSLSKLKPNDVVRYPGNKSWESAKHTTPRSYHIKTAQGTNLRRNRCHLKKTIESPPPSVTMYIDDDNESTVPESPPPLVNPQPVSQDCGANENRSRSGRIIRLPMRYRDD